MPTASELAVSPYLCIRDAEAAIAFYTKAFAAEELERYDHQGKVGHSLLKINGGYVMLAEEFLDIENITGNVSPDSLGGKTTTTVSLAVDDAHRWYDRAIAAGAHGLRPVTEEIFGSHGKLRDPFGHVWSVVTLKPSK